MGKKLLFVFSGTGIDAVMMRDSMEMTATRSGELFNQEVIRIYFNGCHDKAIAGRSSIMGRLNPDLEVLPRVIDKSFSRIEGRVKLSFTTLKKELGASILIEAHGVLDEIEEIDDIVLFGRSRGALTTFATAKVLNHLDIPLFLLAEDPVPGNTRNDTFHPESLYSKNIDLTACRNIVRAEIILGTYLRFNSGIENKWFRQMAARFSPETESYIYTIPKKHHNEINRRELCHGSNFFYTRGLTSQSRAWNVIFDRAYTIPKVAQQKFHFGVVGRTEYLPSYKLSLLVKFPFPRNASFKFGQTRLALDEIADRDVFIAVLRAILANTDKAKGLREFIVEFDSILRYSKEQNPLDDQQILLFHDLQQKLYKLIADFHRLERPALLQKEHIERDILAHVTGLKGKLPRKVYNTLKELTTLFLQENTLTHVHLAEFIDESETFESNPLKAHGPMLDGHVTNANELAVKLYHSSLRQRTVIYIENKARLPLLINQAEDIARISQFLTPKQLNELLQMIKVDLDPSKDPRPSLKMMLATMGKIILMMNTLPTHEHRAIAYHAIKNNLIAMEISIADMICFMEYLSEIECADLCTMLVTNEFTQINYQIPLAALGTEKLSHTKFILLERLLNVQRQNRELKQIDRPSVLSPNRRVTFFESSSSSGDPLTDMQVVQPICT